MLHVPGWENQSRYITTLANRLNVDTARPVTSKMPRGVNAFIRHMNKAGHPPYPMITGAITAPTFANKGYTLYHINEFRKHASLFDTNCGDMTLGSAMAIAHIVTCMDELRAMYMLWVTEDYDYDTQAAMCAALGRAGDNAHNASMAISDCAPR